MDKKFSGKVALITGAAAGLGYAVAVTFAEMGADLILLDMNGEGLKAVKADCERLGVKAKTGVCDISNEAEVCYTVEAAEKEFGKIDFLINNAAVWRNYSLFVESTTELWKKYFDIEVCRKYQKILDMLIKEHCLDPSYTGEMYAEKVKEFLNQEL